MSKQLPQWFVPIGTGQAVITIDDGLYPPAVHLTMPEGPLDGDAHVLTSLETVQLGMALTEASGVAGQLRAKAEARKR